MSISRHEVGGFFFLYLLLIKVFLMNNITVLKDIYLVFFFLRLLLIKLFLMNKITVLKDIHLQAGQVANNIDTDGAIHLTSRDWCTRDFTVVYKKPQILGGGGGGVTLC